MNVLQVPDPGLKLACQSVLTLDLDALKRIVEMFEEIKKPDPTNRNAPRGIGLAAAQVGWDARLFVMNIEQTPGGEKLYVNPEVTWRSKEQTVALEGCLSVPGGHYLVSRPRWIRAKAQVLSGFKIRNAVDAGIAAGLDLAFTESQLGGIHARCFQHELDHLFGLTIVDTGKPISPPGLSARN
jgi:peptide deformylase